jgi:hypothetical protein
VFSSKKNGVIMTNSKLRIAVLKIKKKLPKQYQKLDTDLLVHLSFKRHLPISKLLESVL